LCVAPLASNSKSSVAAARILQKWYPDAVLSPHLGQVLETCLCNFGGGNDGNPSNIVLITQLPLLGLEPMEYAAY
jgi:hypothetical protein